MVGVARMFFVSFWEFIYFKDFLVGIRIYVFYIEVCWGVWVELKLDVFGLGQRGIFLFFQFLILEFIQFLLAYVFVCFFFLVYVISINICIIFVVCRDGLSVLCVFIYFIFNMIFWGRYCFYLCFIDEEIGYREVEFVRKWQSWYCREI